MVKTRAKTVQIPYKKDVNEIPIKILPNIKVIIKYMLKIMNRVTVSKPIAKM